ncbi:unnamed protein product, partial [Sphacelaria rigidula]
ELDEAAEDSASEGNSDSYASKKFIEAAPIKGSDPEGRRRNEPGECRGPDGRRDAAPGLATAERRGAAPGVETVGRCVATPRLPATAERRGAAPGVETVGRCDATPRLPA